MKAIILAAGRGSRMENLTSQHPKCLTQLNGKSILDWQLEALKGAGIEDIAIVRGYLGHQLTRDHVTYFENPRWDETNMVVSLACAEAWLKSHTCLVSYADIFYPPDTALRLKEEPGDIVITYDNNWLELWQARFEDPLADAETFQKDENGVLIEIGNRAMTIEEIHGQYMGLLKFTPSGWEGIATLLSKLTREELDKLDMTALLQRLIQDGFKIKTVAIHGKWGEIDNENDLKLYTSIIESRGKFW